ncbi:MAG: radical SAM family heme chaperone HemW [Gammaproteobacteria bacterium]
MPSLSLYIHFPWCVQKCPYCDFNSHALKTELPEQRYIDALLTDLEQDLEQFEETRPLQSIFLGGGTPSLFSPNAIQRLLTGVQQRLAFDADIEITLEANPGTVESAKFVGYPEAGINRLSLGIQSFNDRHLQHLRRIHSAREAVRAVETAHQAGLANINLDLMFGLPEQTPEEARADILQAIALEPTHLSFYQLTIEPNTYFHKFPPRLPHDEAIFTIQQACQQLLDEHGYEQYEISAYARPEFSCRHNRHYWQFGDYLGIGAGAHGKISRALPDQIVRYWKVKGPEAYLQAAATPQRFGDCYSVAPQELPLEYVMNHLRLRRGFDLQSYSSATGLDAHTLEPAMTHCIEQNLLVKANSRVYCSESGWNFLDTVLQHFINC